MCIRDRPQHTTTTHNRDAQPQHTTTTHNRKHITANATTKTQRQTATAKTHPRHTATSRNHSTQPQHATTCGRQRKHVQTNMHTPVNYLMEIHCAQERAPPVERGPKRPRSKSHASTCSKLRAPLLRSAAGARVCVRQCCCGKTYNAEGEGMNKIEGLLRLYRHALP